MDDRAAARGARRGPAQCILDPDSPRRAGKQERLAQKVIGSAEGHERDPQRVTWENLLMPEHSPPLAHLVRIAGAPGSGKSLLVTALTEAFRARGVRTASAERRPDGVTVFVMPASGRATLDRPLALDDLPAMLRSLDPSARLLLAEGYPKPDDGLLPPTVEVLMWGVGPTTPAPALIATVDGAALLRQFQRTGPSNTGLAAEVADAIQARVLGDIVGGVARETPTLGGRIKNWLRR